MRIYCIHVHHQNAEEYLNIKITNQYFENTAKFKYLVKEATNQNFINEEIRSRLNSACCLIRVLNTVSHINGRTQVIQENILTYTGGSDCRIEKTA
jgi:hypothetical protein